MAPHLAIIQNARRDALVRNKDKGGRLWVTADDALGQEGQPSSPALIRPGYRGHFEGEWHQYQTAAVSQRLVARRLIDHRGAKKKRGQEPFAVHGLPGAGHKRLLAPFLLRAAGVCASVRHGRLDRARAQRPVKLDLPRDRGYIWQRLDPPPHRPTRPAPCGRGDLWTRLERGGHETCSARRASRLDGPRGSRCPARARGPASAGVGAGPRARPGPNEGQAQGPAPTDAPPNTWVKVAGRPGPRNSFGLAYAQSATAGLPSRGHG